MTGFDKFNIHTLDLNPNVEVDRITAFILHTVRSDLRRGGCVIGVSGGVDSAVVLALCVRAFDADQVVAVAMPEKESDPSSLQLAKRVCEHYGVRPVNEDISESLAGFDCYGRRDRAIARLIPGYDAAKGYKSKIVLPDNLLQEGGLNIFSLVVVDPKGKETKVRLPVKELREITAASNIKQRTRMTMLYYHAELRNYAVVGTANKNEHDLGFFVKYGDGGADMKPIAHLFKTQVYQLAENLDVPEEIRTREPATDTYSAGGSQQEFFFRVPFEVLDAVWYGFELGIPNQIIADGLDLSVLQVERVINDILRKQKTTAYLRTLAQGLD